MNVRLISDLCGYENKDDLQVQLKTPSPPFKEMLDHVTPAEPSNKPNKIDYQKTSNPYESRYGPDWHIELKKSSLLICYACVRDMIEHMASEKKVFIGTTHKNYCLFYHTALSLMTAATEKDTRNWMKEKGYEEMWILPEMDIFTS